MSKFIGLSLRALEFAFTIIIMGMIGNIIAMAWSGNPASINYSMFTAAFSLASLFYLIPATWSEDIAGHPIILIVVDLLNMIFFLCAGIALAARLHVHSCKNQDYLASNGITNGTSPDQRETRCREAQASCAFMWFTWACYTGSLCLSLISGRSSTNLRPRPSVRRPGMAQV